MAQFADQRYGVGNHGLLGQLAALRRVGDNIAAFGGDARNIAAAVQATGDSAIHYVETTGWLQVRRVHRRAAPHHHRARDRCLAPGPIVATLTGSGPAVLTAVVDDIPNLAGFLPRDRIHVNLPPSHRAIDQVTVRVQGEGASASETLSFQLDDNGWTDRSDA